MTAHPAPVQLPPLCTIGREAWLRSGFADTGPDLSNIDDIGAEHMRGPRTEDEPGASSAFLTNRPREFCKRSVVRVGMRAGGCCRGASTRWGWVRWETGAISVRLI